MSTQPTQGIPLSENLLFRKTFTNNEKSRAPLLFFQHSRSLLLAPKPLLTAFQEIPLSSPLFGLRILISTHESSDPARITATLSSTRQGEPQIKEAELKIWLPNGKLTVV